MKKVFIMILSAMMGMGALAPVPVLAEEEIPLQEEVSEEPVNSEETEDTSSSWRTVVTEEEYNRIKDMNFESRRLIAAVDGSYIFDKSVVLSEYNGVYLLQFEDNETAQAAYAYLSRYAEFIDVDSAVFVSEDEEEAPAVAANSDEMSEEENPFTALEGLIEEKSSEEETHPVQEKGKTIALIDTGAGYWQTAEDGTESEAIDSHITKRVSVLPVKEEEEESKRTEASHADHMVSFISEEADNAKILSIQALDDNGIGNVSAVYAGIMYAIESEADIINLSLSAAATAENAVLKDAVKQATDKGIKVVASAGNNNKNLKFYTPGNIEEAYTIGAVDAEGHKIESSNYGELMDYAVKADSTSEAAARFSGILYSSSIEDIEASLNSGKVYSPVKEKEVPVAEPEPVEEPVTEETGEFTTTADRGVVAIESLEAQVIAGAKLSGDKYVWNANRNAEDHRFAFRVSYSTSGIDKLEAGELQIRVPITILKDRYGNYADKYDISFPREDEVEPFDILNNMVYRIEGNEMVIYNRFEVPAATEGYFEISYYTTKKAVEYIDMAASDPFYADMAVKGATVETLTAQSNRLPVYLNTTVYLKSTVKKYPQIYKTWQSDWGPEPADSADNWYIRWEIVSEVNTDLTQPYTFNIDDTITSFRAWNDDDEELTVTPDLYRTYGFRLAGTSSYTDSHTQTNEKRSGKRYDYVITAIDAEFFANTKRFNVENSIVTTVTPIDGVDEATSASSVRVFKYQRPIFVKPHGHFQVYKYADGSYRAKRKDLVWDLGVKYAQYSRYDLDQLKDGKVSYLDNFDYLVMGLGFPYPWTLENDAEWADPTKYGVKPVLYSLVDNGVYLHEDGGVENKTEPMTSDDYQIDSLKFISYNNDAVFDEDQKIFRPTSVTYNDNDILTFFIKMNNIDNDWISAATYNLKTGESTYDSSYVTGIEGKQLFFVDNVVAFKIETENAHYYTNLRGVPYMRLKNSEYVLNKINEWPSVALRNYSYLEVYQDSERIFFNDEADTDFARITQRDAFVDKKVVSSHNEVKKKQYRITWQMYGFERYILNEGVPEYVEQESGTFYDLLPAGLEIDKNSVMVAVAKDPTAKTKTYTYLSDTAFDVTLTPNYRDTGRTLLKVHVKEPANNYYLFFDTLIDWNTITDLGTDVYNPMAYETGNDSIKDGRPDDGGKLKEKDLMSNLNDSAEDRNTFIYGEENFDIVAITAGNTGLLKQVKTEEESVYTYNSVTIPNGNYTYRLRYANSFFNKAKDMILFDSLETYGTPGMVGDDIVDHESDWRGTLQGVDVSQLEVMGIKPVIYVSETEHLNLDVAENHDISNTAVWVSETDYLAAHEDLSAVKAIAIDARKDENGNDYILNQGQSIMAVVFMKAPAGADSDGSRIPEAFNNVYLQNTIIDRFENENPFYIHHDYTTIQFVVKADVKLEKVSSEDSTVKIPNIQFRITGTSDYGTETDIIKSTDRNGAITFEGIEKGSYILQEYQGTPDWMEDHTEHQLVIDENARVWIDGVEYTDTPIVIENDPRVHANIRLLKKETNTSAELTFEPDEWDPETMVKYAVAIYGIEQDYDENGDKMGLTFGPATGADYTNSFKSHIPTGNTAAGNAHRCVHNDSWDAITYWNLVDPYVYEQCVKEGCTHSVNLTLSKTLKNPNFVVDYTGDGPAVLAQEFSQTGNGQDTSFNISNNNIGGWGASRIRAMLNGADELTNKNPVNGATLIVAGNAALRYTAGNTLFDAFPMILQQRIGAKQVKYDSVRNAVNEANLKTAFDKLWLFSSFELGTDASITNNNMKHPQESLPDGNVYQRLTENNTLLSTSNNGFLAGYSADSQALVIYGRSIYNVTLANYILCLSPKGALNNNSCGLPYGVSPFFCLSRNISNLDPSITGSPAPAWLEDVLSYQAKSSRYYLNGMIPNTEFKLYGTSDYGTEISEVAVSSDRGVVTFENIEKGTYELREIKENPDFVKNETVWHVTIDDNGLVSSDMVAENSLYYSVENNPRYWDFSIRKVDAEDNKIWLQGATVHLYGTSDFGTAVDITATSDANGKIDFEELEKGNYFLEETIAPTGVDANGHTGTGGTRNYIADPVKRIVTINEQGRVKISGLKKGSTGEFFLENERALDGRITVLKHWIFIEGEELPTPQLTLSSENPETEPTYVITYDANGGLFDNNQTTNLVYMVTEGKLNVIKSGTVKEPSHPENYMVFKGWFTDRDGTVPFDPTAELTSSLTVYAKWLDTRVRYAVSVYGIGQDIDINGNTMGLTFGPATGADYTNSFKAHTPDGTTIAGNEHRCIHNDSWEDIIYWNKIDPEVYEQCVKECCTKSVVLTLSDDLRNDDYAVNYFGDGPSGILYPLYKDHNWQHLRWNPFVEGGGPNGKVNGTSFGGWGASRIRAMMNGADELTTKTEGSTYSKIGANVNFPVENYTAENALITAFPEILQSAIGKKAVKYDSVFSSLTVENLKTSYDKLWLLSGNEMGTPSSYKHPLEGLVDGIYQRFTENNLPLSTTPNDFFKIYVNPGDWTYYWLRSVHGSYLVTCVKGVGRIDQAHPAGVSTSVVAAVCPCFALSR